MEQKPELTFSNVNKVFDRLKEITEKADKLAITLYMVAVERKEMLEVDAQEIIDDYYSVRGEP